MTLIKIKPYKNFGFQKWLISKNALEEFEAECFEKDKAEMTTKNFINMFKAGNLTQELIEDFILFMKRHLECGTQLIMVISNTDPNINTRDEAINYVIENSIDKIKYKELCGSETYEEYLEESEFTNTNSELLVDIGILGKYFISIISVPC